MEFKKGEIVRATKRDRSEGFHYIAVWTDFDDGNDFVGIMLTTSTTEEYADNVLLEIDHIKKGLDFEWQNSHFVNRLFIKFSVWGPFTKVGELTESGIKFISDNLQDIPPVTFDEYDAKRRSA